MKDYNLGIEKLGIEELDKNNAAKLILKVAEGSKLLDDFKNEEKLANHDLFNNIKLYPGRIVEIGKMI